MREAGESNRTVGYRATRDASIQHKYTSCYEKTTNVYLKIDIIPIIICIIPSLGLFYRSGLLQFFFFRLRKCLLLFLFSTQELRWSSSMQRERDLMILFWQQFFSLQTNTSILMCNYSARFQFISLQFIFLSSSLFSFCSSPFLAQYFLCVHIVCFLVHITQQIEVVLTTKTISVK